MRRPSGAETPRPPARPSERAAVLVLLLALALLVAVFTLVFLPAERRQALATWEGRLSAMADDRKAAIENWVSERLNDAIVVATYPEAVSLARAAAGEPLPHAAREAAERQLSTHLDATAAAYGNGGVYVLDAAGRVLVGSAASHALEEGCLAFARAVLGSGVPALDFHQHADGSPVVSAAAAVRAPAADGRPGQIVGAVLLSADPKQWLYPLLQREAVPSETGECVVMRRQGDEALFLSPLRHSDAAPMAFSRPLNTAEFAAKAALDGRETFSELSDYRGERIFAATRWIGNAPWGLVAKVDRSEALAPYAHEVVRAALVLAAFVLAVATAAAALWRVRRAQYDAALARARARLGLLLDHASDAILFVGADGRIREASRRAEEKYGYPGHELVGKSVLTDLRPADSQAQAPGQLEEALARGELLFETVHRHASGRTFPVEVSSRKVELDGEQVLLSVIRDISERKAVEQRYRELVENMSGCVAVYRAVGDGEDFAFVEFNRAAERIDQIDRNQVLGKRVTEVFPGVVEFGLFEVFQRVWRSGEPQHFPVRHYRDQRIAGWRDNFVYRLPSGDVVAVYDDLTERKQAEEALASSEERYRELADSISDVFFALDVELRYTSWNQASEDLTGVAVEEAVGKSLFELFPGAEGSEVEARYREALRTKTPLSFEQLFSVRDKEYVFEVNVYPTADGISVIAKNVSERKRAEEERERLLARVRGLAKRVAEAQEEQRRQLARELHDRVGQNLSALTLNLSVLRAQLPEEACARLASRFDDAAALLEETIRQTRGVMTELRPPLLDEVGLLAALRWYSEQLSRRAQIEVMVEESGSGPRLAAETEIALFRIAQEALTNVAKHARARRVEVELGEDERGTRLIIADDGIGFELPSREAAGQFRGWGLVGMQERAESVGAAVSVESAPGEGTRVIIRVPA